MSDFNITLFEACELLNRSKKSISRYIRRGLLHPEKVKSQQGTLEYRFTKADIEAFKDEEELLPVEILQNSIVSLAEAFETFKKTRLKQDTIITLLHDTSKVSKRDIKTILNCLSELKRLYLK